MTLIKIFLSTVCVVVLTNLHAQQNAVPCCTIVDIARDSGMVTIRNHTQYWIKWFKPSALDFAELKIGDSVHASLSLQQVSRIKNKHVSYALIQPRYGDTCCEVLYIAADTVSMPVVTARNKRGEVVRFGLPDSVAARLAPGNKIYSSASHGFAMVLTHPQSDTTMKMFYGFPLLPKPE